MHADATPSEQHRICAGALDPGAIKLLNWNIQKQRHPNWHKDLSRLAHDVDLALIQEATLGPDIFSVFSSAKSHTFARGYTRANRVTGVMTLARVEHLSHRQLAIREPWLRTLKATNITTYALHGSAQTLLVINLHALNFSLGISAYLRQMNQIMALLSEHQGPVILGGDFNTWHRGRERIVKDMTGMLEMEAVNFSLDHRTRILGRHLDHVFIRGLKTMAAETHCTLSSDHNPMLITLSISKVSKVSKVSKGSE
ncbi:MAG: endonuclease/exonuclease/phosphatase family protein [Pseudomonadales bacterium]|nr:endonuclease/exonuclease/phosphatase family protein [Pseudomonadales bacterium]